MGISVLDFLGNLINSPRKVIKARYHTDANDQFCERMSQAGCLCQAEKRMKVSSTPTLMGRGNEGKTQGKTHVKADAEQGNGPES